MIALLINYFMTLIKKVKIIKPAIILVRPQLPENIGMVARGMDNCGLDSLILVEPREVWPNNIAIKSSANSSKIISKCKIYKNLEDALSPFNFVVATSNRKRFVNKPIQDNMNELFNQFPNSKKVAIIFGPENSGLSNKDLMLADLIFSIDTADSNKSLNLSHAVLLLSFSWREFFILNKKTPKYNVLNNKLALKKDFHNFMIFLEKELNDVGFLYPKAKSQSMFENIQSMLMRSALSDVEVKTLWGMVKKLRK
jgi:tRNA/rRNA methyltransferase